MELRLFSYEIKHFNMALCKINTNNMLNIFNIDESGILLIYTIFWAFYMYKLFTYDAYFMSY